jgi:hypothetical protein
VLWPETSAGSGDTPVGVWRRTRAEPPPERLDGFHGRGPSSAVYGTATLSTCAVLDTFRVEIQDRIDRDVRAVFRAQNRENVAVDWI